MSVWREVQEKLYQRWREGWVDDDANELTPFFFNNEDGFDPPDGPHAKFMVTRQPGGPETLGPKGRRKMNRVGLLTILLREPPGDGVGSMSDLGEKAAKLFENCRLEPHDIRFAQVEPGDEREIEDGRWWGLVVSGRFDYEEHN